VAGAAAAEGLGATGRAEEEGRVEAIEVERDLERAVKGMAERGRDVVE